MRICCRIGSKSTKPQSRVDHNPSLARQRNLSTCRNVYTIKILRHRKAPPCCVLNKTVFRVGTPRLLESDASITTMDLLKRPLFAFLKLSVHCYPNRMLNGLMTYNSNVLAHHLRLALPVGILFAQAHFYSL